MTTDRERAFCEYLQRDNPPICDGNEQSFNAGWDAAWETAQRENEALREEARFWQAVREEASRWL